MTGYWDGDTGRSDVVSMPSDLNTFIRVNGSDVEVQPNTSFTETVVKVAEDAGLGKFRLFLDGNEVLPNDAPDIISEGSRIELRPFEVAGI